MSARALTNNDSDVTRGQINAALAGDGQLNIAEELKGLSAIGGFGTESERTNLISNIKGTNRGTSNTGTLNYNNKAISYETVYNNDGSVSVIDTTVGSNTGNLIGVATINNNSELIFAENPDYFNEARD